MPYKYKKDIKENKQNYHKKMYKLKWYRKKRSKSAKIRWLKLKRIIISHYSKEDNKCACCKERHLEFLSIDHIKGGGTKHRKEIGAGNFYIWIIRNNFPDGFRVLCFNCNWAMRLGKCPHKRSINIGFKDKSSYDTYPYLLY